MKHNLLTTFVTILTILLFSSCHFNSQFINREEDIKEAEQITNKLYELIKIKNFEGTTELFSNDFFKGNTKDKLILILSTTNEKLGDLSEIKVDQSESRVVSGTDASSNYRFIYKIKYLKFESLETITLIKENDGKIKIIGYNINSDGFILSK